MKYAYLFLVLLPLFAIAQEGVSIQVKQFNLEPARIVDPKSFDQDFGLQIENRVAPIPAGHLSKEKKKALKEEVARRYPRKDVYSASRSSRSTESMRVISGFPADFFFNGNTLVGGTPNDNTLAISNGGNLITSWNSRLWAFDIEADTHLFAFPDKHPSLTQFIAQNTDTTLATPFPFDPKLIYDPDRDRFILVFLVGGAPIPPATQGRDPETSNTIVCFSSSSDPKDVWYAYELDGNPLGYTTWTDYPQIAINEHSFYLTLNQLYPDSGWVEGFSETVLWQMDLDAAFAGDRPVPTKFWTGFTHEGRNIRYLHPVKSAMGPEGDDMYFVANRPFTVTNDTFFLVKLSGDAEDPNTNVDVTLMPSDLTYGHPPYAMQSGGGQTFWTNDARVLGAVKIGDEIQFTGNSIDTVSGKASIYHAVISDINNPSVTGAVMPITDRELGFPNIAFAGVTSSDHETTIFVNHTGETVAAGNSVIYYDDNRQYSELQSIKEGETYVDMLSWDDERWGDYVGIQRKFNATSRIWVSGYWGFGSEKAGIWVSELGSPKDGPVGVDESQAPSIHMFPNPALDVVKFEFSLEKDTDAEILIHDLSGKLVARIGRANIQKGDNSMSFDTSSLQSGVYLVSLRNSGDVLWQEKLVRP